MAFVRKLAQEHLLERAFALCQDAGDATKRMKPGRARMTALYASTSNRAMMRQSSREANGGKRRAAG